VSGALDTNSSVAASFTSWEVLQAVGAPGLEVEPQLQASDVENVVAFRKLLESVSVIEIIETNRASDDTILSQLITEGNNLDFLELRLLQSSLHEKDAVLVHVSDYLVPVDHFFLDVCESVLVDFLVELIVVQSAQKLKHRFANF